ncbi:hypothetical protein NLJ89_g6829 [Agrocybe chaxingu]|uniref:Enoyl reductase (ER) domain-containing protein n=1 Tax=Agrocybe chaxingu TaxID=84603 RepID=A0A9W8MU96_9AGAR|nr:hypothetical protein NLJ89_g6829 [Agrocybe chaxingu]
MIPPTQRALVFKRGTPSVVNRAVPTPANGEILVKICSAALNPIDGSFAFDGFSAGGVVPEVLGCDAAGLVQHVGPGVTGFIEGDPVFYQCNFLDSRTTSFQQYAVIPADLAAKVPTNVSLDEASTFGITSGTAAIGMYHTREGLLGSGLTPPWVEGGKGKYKGQAYLVVGGSSSIGQYAIQFARISGFSPIITTAAPKHAEYLKSIGATYVLDRSLSQSGILSAIRSALGSTPLNYALEAISYSDTIGLALAALAPGGTLASAAGGAGYVKDGKTVVNIFGSLHTPQNLEFGRGFIAGLRDLLATGESKPNRVEVLQGGLNGIPEGLRRISKGAVGGIKLVARPQETK